MESAAKYLNILKVTKLMYTKKVKKFDYIGYFKGKWMKQWLQQTIAY